MAEWQDMKIELNEHPTQNAVDFAKNLNAFYGMLGGVMRMNILVSAVLILFLGLSIGAKYGKKTNQSLDADTQ